MVYVQDFSKMIDESQDIVGDFADISKIIATGDVQYAYPYALKEFLIKYAKMATLVLEKSSEKIDQVD